VNPFQNIFMSTATNKLKKVLSQYKHESETWKRYLQFIQQENNHLKTRLSQVLQHDTDVEFLERAEFFQNKFLSEDETVHLLRQDVHEMEYLLTKEILEDGVLMNDLQKRFKKLNRDMETVERQFNKLKTDFNSFLSDAA
jgi:hypoxanthine-guanine phosphoribosyltransferase